MRRYTALSVRPLALFFSKRTNTTNNEESVAEIPKDEKKRKEMYEGMQRALSANQAEIDELRKQNLYSAAEAENERKKFRQEIAELKLTVASNFGKDLLEVYDGLDSVCKNIQKYESENKDIPKNIVSIFSGVMLSSKVVLKTFGRNGIKPLEITPGSPFDPKTCVSLYTSPSTPEMQAGHITEIVKHGFKFNDVIIRPAEVGVAEDPEK